jgi:hypothetical protein
VETSNRNRLGEANIPRILSLVWDRRKSMDETLKKLMGIGEVEKLKKENNLLKKVVKAHERLDIAYRVGGQVPDWVWETIGKWTEYQIDEGEKDANL